MPKTKRTKKRYALDAAFTANPGPARDSELDFLFSDAGDQPPNARRRRPARRASQRREADQAGTSVELEQVKAEDQQHAENSRAASGAITTIAELPPLQRDARSAAALTPPSSGPSPRPPAPVSSRSTAPLLSDGPLTTASTEPLPEGAPPAPSSARVEAPSADTARRRPGARRLGSVPAAQRALPPAPGLPGFVSAIVFGGLGLLLRAVHDMLDH
jgi:hypothetical protein